MALKFLNKKGWHTGSLRNIETVWKAEQKHEAEHKKLEELKKQILDERERLEFRRLQEHAGLVPKQERLDFLYESGLAVGKVSEDPYLLGKPVEEKKSESEIVQVAAAPGALFVEEKPYSANDAWRKLHSDPLLLIRQQEQAALARIRNNPVKMEMIQKSVTENLKREKEKEKRKAEKEHSREKRKKQIRENSCLRSTSCSDDERHQHKDDNHKNKTERHGEKGDHSSKGKRDTNSLRTHGEYEIESRERRDKTDASRSDYYNSRASPNDLKVGDGYMKRNGGSHTDDSHHSLSRRDIQYQHLEKKRVSEERYSLDFKDRGACDSKGNLKPKHKLIHEVGKLSEEEKAARLRQMQADAELHEEQRWHRLKRAAESDMLEEAKQMAPKNGRNFLDVTTRSVYGAEQGGSASVEESVRRRAHFINRSIGDGNANTFRR